MKIENLERATELIKAYRSLSDFIENITHNCPETVAIVFPLSDKYERPVRIDLPYDTAETMLFNQKNRLERELESMGVKV